MRFKQSAEGNWLPCDVKHDLKHTEIGLHIVAAEHEIDISDCETPRDICERFIAFGQKSENTEGLPSEIASLTVPQLKRYVEEHEIDIGGATLKPDILSAIWAAMNS